MGHFILVGEGDSLSHTSAPYLGITPYSESSATVFMPTSIIDNKITLVAIFCHLALCWVFLTAPFWNKNPAGYLL